MHVGERPYVLSPGGSSNLSERTLTVDAMKGVLNDLLSPADQETLDDIGAVEREITSKTRRGTSSSWWLRAAATTSGSSCAASAPSVRIPQPQDGSRGPGPIPPVPATAPGLGDLVAGRATPRARAWRRAIRRPSRRRRAAPTRTSGPASPPPAQTDEPALDPSADAPDGSCPRHVRQASCCRWRAARFAPRDRARAPRRRRAISASGACSASPPPAAPRRST